MGGNGDEQEGAGWCKTGVEDREGKQTLRRKKSFNCFRLKPEMTLQHFITDSCNTVTVTYTVVLSFILSSLSFFWGPPADPTVDRQDSQHLS